MTTPPPEPATYLEEAADILRDALAAAVDQYNNAPYPRTPEDRRELLEARARVAEGFARLHEADRAGGNRPEPEGQDHA